MVPLVVQHCPHCGGDLHCEGVIVVHDPDELEDDDDELLDDEGPE